MAQAVESFFLSVKKSGKMIILLIQKQKYENSKNSGNL